MSMVNTVTGEVDSGDLGVTYMHEHIFIVQPEMQYYWPGYHGWDEDEYVQKARYALRKMHDEYGVNTILDATCAGLGRNVRAVARAGEGSGLNVIVATGLYAYDQLRVTYFTKDLKEKTAELEMLFMKDTEEGLEGTTMKPGVIKCTTDKPGVTPDNEALLRATARAHLRSGLPIITHTDYTNKGGLLQQRIFKEEGVDMRAVVIGHCNQSGDLAYIEKLIEAGSLVGFDRCGMDSPAANFEQQLDNLADLCQRGYSKRIVLSHDNMVYIDTVPSGMFQTFLTERARPNFPYGTIYAEILPGLRERGVTEQQIKDMLVEAPRAVLSRQDATALSLRSADAQVVVGSSLSFLSASTGTGNL